MKIRQYAKSIVATIGGTVTTLLGVIPDRGTESVILTVIAAACTSIGTYLVPNKK